MIQRILALGLALLTILAAVTVWAICTRDQEGE